MTASKGICHSHRRPSYLSRSPFVYDTGHKGVTNAANMWNGLLYNVYTRVTLLQFVIGVESVTSFRALLFAVFANFA